MMNQVNTITRAVVLAAALTGLGVGPAFADATAFIGANRTPSNRMVRGFAVGVAVLVVGVEFEYAHTPDDAEARAPSLKTGMGNVLLQAPFPIYGIQPYVTTGGGFYREALDLHEDTGVGLNIGGGVKVSLMGPLRLRLDYRVFKLGSGALHSPAQRVYAGITLAF